MFARERVNQEKITILGCHTCGPFSLNLCSSNEVPQQNTGSGISILGCYFLSLLSLVF